MQPLQLKDSTVTDYKGNIAINKECCFLEGALEDKERHTISEKMEAYR
jgi:hypothetical protein